MNRRIATQAFCLVLAACAAWAQDPSPLAPKAPQSFLNVARFSPAQANAQNLEMIFGGAPKLKGARTAGVPSPTGRASPEAPLVSPTLQGPAALSAGPRRGAASPAFDHRDGYDDDNGLQVLPSITILGGLGKTPDGNTLGMGGGFVGANFPFKGRSQEKGSLTIDVGPFYGGCCGYDRVTEGPMKIESGISPEGHPWEIWREVREKRGGERYWEIAGVSVRSPLLAHRFFVDFSVRVARRSADLSRQITEATWKRQWSPTAINHTHERIIDRYNHWHEGEDHWHEGDSHWHWGFNHEHEGYNHEHPGYDHDHGDFDHRHPGEDHWHPGESHWHEGEWHQHPGYWERHPGYNHDHLVTQAYQEYHPGWIEGQKSIQTLAAEAGKRARRMGAAYSIGGGIQVHRDVAIKAEALLLAGGLNGVRFGLHITPGGKD